MQNYRKRGKGRDRGGKRKKKRHILHLLIYTPNGCYDEGWVRPKSEGWCFISIFHMGGGNQIFGESSTTFPGH